MSSPYRTSTHVTCVYCGVSVPREQTDVTERGERCRRCSDIADVRSHGTEDPAIDWALAQWRPAVNIPAEVVCVVCNAITPGNKADVVGAGARCPRCTEAYEDAMLELRIATAEATKNDYSSD
jgi:hypothetical protein